MANDDRVITLTDEALHAILEIRDREPDAADLALRLAITGVQGLDFAYELTFVPADDPGVDAIVESHGELPVVIPEGSVAHLRGASLHVQGTGLAIDNPNSPIPRIEPGAATPGTLSERVDAVLRDQINPAIAMHGGWAELVEVDGTTAYLRLGGGCQGCGMAAMTLRHGIERAIRAAVPEIADIIDVTDHASGANPYYEPSTK
jgi:Fe/S biogenesis protein NfuA